MLGGGNRSIIHLFIHSFIHSFIHYVVWNMKLETILPNDVSELKLLLLETLPFKIFVKNKLFAFNQNESLD